MTVSILQNKAEQLREVTELLEGAKLKEDKLFLNLEGAKDALRHAKVELQQHQAVMLALAEKRTELLDDAREILLNAG